MGNKTLRVRIPVHDDVKEKVDALGGGEREAVAAEEVCEEEAHDSGAQCTVTLMTVEGTNRVGDGWAGCIAGSSSGADAPEDSNHRALVELGYARLTSTTSTAERASSLAVRRRTDMDPVPPADL